MAEGKASFVLYTDLIHMVRKLPKETRGDLFLIILEYVNDNLSTVEAMEQVDILLSVTFEPIKQQLKRDLKKYEKRQQQRVDAGKRSAEARAAQRNSTTVDDSSISSGVSVSVNGNVNGNVNGSGNVISKDIDDGENTPPPKKYDFFIPTLEIESYMNSETQIMWFEGFCMNNHITPEELKKKITEFVKDLRDKNIQEKYKNDLFIHFANFYNNGKRINSASGRTNKTTGAEPAKYGLKTKREIKSAI